MQRSHHPLFAISDIKFAWSPGGSDPCRGEEVSSHEKLTKKIHSVYLPIIA